MLPAHEAHRNPDIAELRLEKTSYLQYMWLIQSGAPQQILPKLDPRVCRGYIDDQKLFKPDPSGETFLVFETRYDLVFWQPRTGRLASLSGHAFALGDLALNEFVELDLLYIFRDPLDWLRNGSNGIVVLDWRQLPFHVLGIAQLCVSQELVVAVQAALALGLPQIVPVIDGEVR